MAARFSFREDVNTILMMGLEHCFRFIVRGV